MSLKLQSGKLLVVRYLLFSTDKHLNFDQVTYLVQDSQMFNQVTLI